MKKIISLTLAVFMLLTLSACGGEPAVESIPEETQPAEVGVDYSEKFINTFSENGNYFFNTTEIPVFNELPLKDIKGLRLSALNGKFSFAANCEGYVKIFAWTEGVSDTNAEVKVKITIDEETTKTLRLVSAGSNMIISDSLPRGSHSFTIEKLSGGANLYIGAVIINGEIEEAPLLCEENGIYVEVFAPENGTEYSNFNVYTKTTHPSGEYYIRYRFVYEQNAHDNSLTWSNGGNTGANRTNYRIRTAQIVKKTGDPGFLTIHEILQSGEISLAIKEYDPVTKKNAGDFVGGFHGDENMKTVSLVLDGKDKIHLFEGEAGFYNCTSLDFKQETIINRCHTTDDYVMNHIQHYLIDTTGIKLLQQVEWLVDNFTPSTGQTYIQMFTLNRINRDKSGDFLTTALNLLDEDGKVIAKADLTAFDPGEKEGVPAASSPDARYAEYFGNDKGIYAKVGFQFVDNSVKLNSAMISVRKHGDSKWYPSFGDPKGTPAKGDIWTINSIYYIDYNPAQ